MVDYVLAGLGAVLFAFLICFIVSFVTLRLIRGIVHLISLGYRVIMGPKAASYQEQAV